jgi:two-component system catabolic regulation response regulator CreB
MKPKILIIEDEPAIVDTIAYALKTDGFDPVSCSTGEEGKAALVAGDAALVILDLGLPDMDGLELCKEIRRESNIPIIFLTARKEEIDKVVGLEVGGDDYVTKPFSPRELTARVKAVLRRTRPEGPPSDDTDDVADVPFAVDRERCRITYFDTPLDLTRYEFRILEILVGKPGWIFSRDKLLDMAWEEPGTVLDRTVDAHVKTLRAKLREVRSEVDPIVTHRGFGYSLKETW